jgi:hypothetical protein
MKNNLLKSLLVAIIATSTMMLGCKKDEKSTQGNGKFTYNGTSYSGECIAISSVNCTGGTTVQIVADGGNRNVQIHNIPSASSGTTNLKSWDKATDCDITIAYLIGTVGYASTSGSVTKTGAKSFTFTATLYDFATGQSPHTISGSGSY